MRLSRKDPIRETVVYHLDYYLFIITAAVLFCSWYYCVVAPGSTVVGGSIP